MPNHDSLRDRFLETNDAFQAAMLNAIRAHQAGIAIFSEALQGLDALQASVDALKENDAELKRLIMEQGAEIKAMRQRLNGGPT